MRDRPTDRAARPRDEALRARDAAASAAGTARDAPDTAPRLAREAVPALAPDAVDGFGLHADAAPQQVERAGVIASFILNAAMIPGWPPPRPFVVPEAGELLAGFARGAAPAGEPILALLQRRGASAGALARLRQTLARLVKSRRLRVLLGLAALSATIETLLDAVEAELGRLSRDGREEAREEEAGRWHLSV